MTRRRILDPDLAQRRRLQLKAEIIRLMQYAVPSHCPLARTINDHCPARKRPKPC